MNNLTHLLDIMKKLRSPVNGCPWDLEQTPLSLREYIIEEAHELVEAIEESSPSHQLEELGDLLLQIVFLSRIQQEQGHFSFSDVIEVLCEKLVRRHPHVFSDTRVSGADEVKSNWEKIKKKEKRKTSIISDYPDSLPALGTAKRISEQAATVGFDWQALPEVKKSRFPVKTASLKAMEKVTEETGELKKAIESGNPEEMKEELGDLLFAVANVARILGFNPETALRSANRKFKQRFRFMENQAHKCGASLEDMSLEDLEKIWQESKKSE